MEEITVGEMIKYLKTLDKKMPIRIVIEEQNADFPIEGFQVDESCYDGKQALILNYDMFEKW